MFNYLNLQKEKQSKEYKKKIVEDFHAENLTIDLKPYYFSNIIARCSKTMIECNNSKLNFKSTGTEG
jgi:NADH-quinone oxidoreductase subunit G